VHKKQIIAVFLALSSIIVSHVAHADDAIDSNLAIIVNSENPISSIDRHFLADAFLKKVTHWPEDGVIQPVDLKSDSPVRRLFSDEILKRSVMGVKNYWQQLIFSGQDVPPPELENSEQVIRYVLKNPSSIGYISGSSISNGTPRNGIKIVTIK
jgi:ABC-type phosphate transport system substrate-binding protein